MNPETPRCNISIMSLSIHCLLACSIRVPVPSPSLNTQGWSHTEARCWPQSLLAPRATCLRISRFSPGREGGGGLSPGPWWTEGPGMGTQQPQREAGGWLLRDRPGAALAPALALSGLALSFGEATSPLRALAVCISLTAHMIHAPTLGASERKWKKFPLLWEGREARGPREKLRQGRHAHTRLEQVPSAPRSGSGGSSSAGPCAVGGPCT